MRRDSRHSYARTYSRTYQPVCKKSKTLIAGDSLYSVDGMIGGIHAPTTPDMDAARRSLKKYADLDLEAVVCYHGGVCKGNVREQIVKLGQE